MQRALRNKFKLCLFPLCVVIGKIPLGHISAYAPVDEILPKPCLTKKSTNLKALWFLTMLSLTKIAIALDLADELRNIFTQVPYKDIQEVINETR